MRERHPLLHKTIRFYYNVNYSIEYGGHIKETNAKNMKFNAFPRRCTFFFLRTTDPIKQRRKTHINNYYTASTWITSDTHWGISSI